MTEETSDELKLFAQERLQPQSQLEQSEQERDQLEESNSECEQQRVQSEPKFQEQLLSAQSASEEVSLAQSLSVLPKIAESLAKLVTLTQQGLPTESRLLTLKDEVKQVVQEEQLHLQSQLSKLEADLQQAAVERSHLQSQLSKLEADLQQVKLERKQTQANEDTLLNQISELQQRQDQIEDYLQKLADYLATPRGSQPHTGTTSSDGETTPVYDDIQKSDSQSQQPSIHPPPSSEESNLVEKYNSKRDSLSDIAKEVSETEESQNERRLGTSQSAVFETNRRGNYWIITQGGFEYLVPKGHFKINTFNYTTVEFLFECQGYQLGQSQDFKLIKPAKVSSLPGGEKWQLVERGVLQFQSSE